MNAIFRANAKKLRKTLKSDRRLCVRLLADECNIPKSIVHYIVTKDLGGQKNLMSSS